MPRWPEEIGKRRLMRTYARLHADVHSRGVHLKVCFVGGRVGGMGWVGKGWEVFVLAREGTGREGLAKAAQRIVRWCREGEARLFVVGGATF